MNTINKSLIALSIISSPVMASEWSAMNTLNDTSSKIGFTAYDDFFFLGGQVAIDDRHVIRMGYETESEAFNFGYRYVFDENEKESNSEQYSVGISRTSQDYHDGYWYGEIVQTDLTVAGVQTWDNFSVEAALGISFVTDKYNGYKDNYTGLVTKIGGRYLASDHLYLSLGLETAFISDITIINIGPSATIMFADEFDVTAGLTHHDISTYYGSYSDTVFNLAANIRF